MKLKSLTSDLPEPNVYITVDDKQYPAHITIPQPNGHDVAIITHDVSQASKMLGVHFPPSGISTTHIKHMVQKGFDWIDCLTTQPLPPHDAWTSFQMQLFPAISWGLVTVVLSPVKLDKMIQRLYFRALLKLEVNGNIKSSWCTLPVRYGSHGLPNFPLVANWGFPGQAQSDDLLLPFYDLLVEVGLYGNLMSWDHSCFGHLSTQATCFSNLWELSHKFKATIWVNDDQQILPVRLHNRSLMSKFYRIGYTSKKDLESLNMFWKSKNNIHVSDIVLCDRLTTDPFALSDDYEDSKLHMFPVKSQPGLISS